MRKRKCYKLKTSDCVIIRISKNLDKELIRISNELERKVNKNGKVRISKTYASKYLGDLLRCRKL
jgi:hypothetical protein